MAQTDRTMRAIQLDEWGPAANMQLRQVPVPEPTPDQLRIQVHTRPGYPCHPSAPASRRARLLRRPPVVMMEPAQEGHRCEPPSVGSRPVSAIPAWYSLSQPLVGSRAIEVGCDVLA